MRYSALQRQSRRAGYELRDPRASFTGRFPRGFYVVHLKGLDGDSARSTEGF